ncbi:MAG: PilN domain-containing protein [Geminicoccaceae bacterium]
MVNPVGLARAGTAAFFDWWLRELAGLVPRRLRGAGRRERRGLVLELGEGESVLLERTANGERTLGTGAPGHDRRLGELLRRRRRPVTLRLRSELGLRKVLDLPLAARDDVDQLLRFEMDRVTPFRADEVYFAQRVLGSDLPNRRISVELQVAPKRVVERALEIARGLGVVPARIELADLGSDGQEALDLLPGEVGEGRRESRLNRALAVLALVLALIAVGIPLQRQRATVAELEAQVAAARADAEQSLTLRKRLDQISQGAQFLLAEKNRHVLVTEVLAELTRLIPDQAHVVQLQLSGGTVQLQGYAATASDLIGLLDQSPLFKGPRFRSPVIQDPRRGLERFHLSVELVDKGGS